MPNARADSASKARTSKSDSAAVVEYRREGYDMFVGMVEGAKEECVERLFNTVVRTAASTGAASLPAQA